MTNIQSRLDELTLKNDNRVSVFDIQIVDVDNGTISFAGRLLNESQLEMLRYHFADLVLDTSSIRILNTEVHERAHVSTNLAGLYERPTFGMPLSSELCFGTDLEILDEEGSWVFTRQNDGYLGWGYRPYLAEGPAGQATHVVLAPARELRAQADAGSPIVTRVFSGTRVAVEETNGDWAHVRANKSGWMPCSDLRAISELPKSIEQKRRLLVEDSMRMVGVPYLWGGTSGNGIDCSGFVRLLHRWVGIEIPRDADMQYSAAKPVEPPFEPGDLLFFAEASSKRKITHVGMSLGEWTMLHSSRSRNGVDMDRVQEVDFLKAIFVGARSFLRSA
jgi:cell wall-associated NlpC family hydrolase